MTTIAKAMYVLCSIISLCIMYNIRVALCYVLCIMKTLARGPPGHLRRLRLVRVQGGHAHHVPHCRYYFLWLSLLLLVVVVVVVVWWIVVVVVVVVVTLIHIMTTISCVATSRWCYVCDVMTCCAMLCCAMLRYVMVWYVMCRRDAPQYSMLWYVIV